MASLAVEMEVRDDGTGGPTQLGYYKQLLLPSPTANVHVTRATHASPAPTYIYDARVHSLRTGARQGCACVFLV